MRFLIITHVFHKPKGHQWFAYAPYVREMNLWLNYVDEVEIVAPITDTLISEIDIAYRHNKVIFTKIPSIAFINISSAIRALLLLPIIIYKLFRSCQRADHIHLRCPGNIGLLGCFVQVFFPKKIKTAKYAGNWDPNASQPFSYKLQKRILSSTYLTKNMTALVYGDWPNQTKNIKPFFTATYINDERESINPKDYTETLNFIFVGSLVDGKRPLLAIKIIEALHNKGIKVNLSLFGDGILKSELQQYITAHKLNTIINLQGNQKSETVKQALKMSHFAILASKSEGWPKALAEAMFFGVIPIATAISCVPSMLDNENRGVLIEPNINDAVVKIEEALSNLESLKEMAAQASKWSQYYTLDLFNSEIQKLIVA